MYTQEGRWREGKNDRMLGGLCLPDVAFIHQRYVYKVFRRGLCQS